MSRHGFWPVQSSEGRGVLGARGGHVRKSSRSVVISCTADGVGLFLVVHLERIILVFDRSGRGAKGN